LQFIDWFRSGRRLFFVMSYESSGVRTRAAEPPAMTDQTTEGSRLFAKPRFAGFDAARPSAVMPARFRPSIALTPRTNSARRLPTKHCLTSADRPITSALPTSSTQN
jgi:hypothetical protein